MTTVFLTTLPFFLLLGVGVVAGRTQRFAGAEPAINAFVFWIALPAFLFIAIAKTDPSQGVPLAFAGVGLVVTTAVTVGSYVLARLVPAWRRVGPAPFSLTVGYGNVGYLGVPIVIALAGPDAALAAGLSQLIHNLLFMIGYPLIRTIAAHRAEGQSDGLPIRPILKRAILANPVVLSVFAGLAVAMLKPPIPEVVTTTIALLGQAAVPAAMFAIGLTLRPALAGILAGGIPPATIIAASVLKLVALPGATLAAVLLFPTELSGSWGPTLVLMAAMPVSSTAFILSQQYDHDGRFASATIVATSAAAIVTVPLFAAAAGV